MKIERQVKAPAKPESVKVKVDGPGAVKVTVPKPEKQG